MKSASASIADVPGDQGGWVRIRFQRSSFDRAEVAPYPITTYHVYRRVDTPAPVAEPDDSGALTPPPGTFAPPVGYERREKIEDLEF